jgi:hypothetical protein
VRAHLQELNGGGDPATTAVPTDAESMRLYIQNLTTPETQLEQQVGKRVAAMALLVWDDCARSTALRPGAELPMPCHAMPLTLHCTCLCFAAARRSAEVGSAT